MDINKWSIQCTGVTDDGSGRFLIRNEAGEFIMHLALYFNREEPAEMVEAINRNFPQFLRLLALAEEED